MRGLGARNALGTTFPEAHAFFDRVSRLHLPDDIMVNQKGFLLGFSNADQVAGTSQVPHRYLKGIYTYQVPMR